MAYILKLTDVNEYVSKILPEDNGRIVRTVEKKEEAILYSTVGEALATANVLKKRLQARGFMNSTITVHQIDHEDAQVCEACIKRDQELAELQAHSAKLESALKTSRELNDELRKLCAGKDADFQQLRLTVDMQSTTIHGLKADVSFWRSTFETCIKLAEVYITERS